MFNYIHARRISGFTQKYQMLVVYMPWVGCNSMERYIQVKKLLLVRSILILDDQTLSRDIFCERTGFFFNNDAWHQSNQDLSIVCDLLNEARFFNFYDEMRKMFLKDHFYRKMTWKKKVWKRLCVLQDVYWRRKFQSHKSL